MRVRIVTTVAVLAGSLGIAATVAGPVYTALGNDQATSSTADDSTVLAGRLNALNVPPLPTRLP